MKEDKDIQQLKEAAVITLPIVSEVFEQKKPIRIRETISQFPKRDLVVLDAVCNLFDEFGEEKLLSFDQINAETRK